MASWFRKLTHQILINEPFTQKMSSDASLRANVRRKMVVGLGNPGMGGSRHSVGMTVLTALSSRLGASECWKSDRQVSGEVVLSHVGDTQLVLLRPRLLMNVNGVSVAKAAAKFRISPDHIILVHDELDKPLGKFSIKQGGSARGHNGVRSCVECLRTDVMLRLRIGIGRPAERADVNRHVLGRFSKEEHKVLATVLEKSLDLLLLQLMGADQHHSASPLGNKTGPVKKGLWLQYTPSPAGGRRHSEMQTDLNVQHMPSPPKGGEGVDHTSDEDSQHSSSSSS